MRRVTLSAAFFLMLMFAGCGADQPSKPENKYLITTQFNGKSVVWRNCSRPLSYGNSWYFTSGDGIEVWIGPATPWVAIPESAADTLKRSGTL